MVEHLLAKQETGVRFPYPAPMFHMKPELIDNNKIPSYVTRVTETLEKANFEAFLVGGCVRDLIIGREVKDWDMTTNATPEQIIGLFEKTVYENKFGTVAIVIEGEDVSYETSDLEARTYKLEPNIIEVTPYRTEAKYSDNRHPDEVKFADNIDDDLKRRDFTMNALAYNLKGQIKDNFEGIKDIKDKTIRTVGDADERFSEDALRMIRAIRFSAQLDFVVSYETMQAIVKNAHLLKNISAERIRDEFVKIIESPRPAMGVGMLQKLGLLKYIIPELEEGIGCEQGGAHKYDVFEHLLGALDHSANKGFSTEIRLSALFHDIGKPKTRRAGLKKAYTFYGHEVVGARMTKVIMERLKFPKDTIEFVTNMVRRHMFFSDTEQITLSAVRRVIQNVKPEHIWELMQIRECDRVGMAKKEAPYRLRKYHAMIEQCLRDPISVSQLVVDGNILMNELGIKSGPRMGWILNALLEEVLEDPTKNTREYLDKKVTELNTLPDTALKSLADQAKNKKDELESEEITKLNKKHGI